MARTIADFITENITTYNLLFFHGHIPPSILNYYRIYIKFLEMPISGKMERVKELAVEMNLSEKTILRAIDKMEEEINI